MTEEFLTWKSGWIWFHKPIDTIIRDFIKRLPLYQVKVAFQTRLSSELGYCEDVRFHIIHRCLVFFTIQRLMDLNIEVDGVDLNDRKRFINELEEKSKIPKILLGQVPAKTEEKNERSKILGKRKHTS